MRILFECYSCEPHRGSEDYNGWRWPLTMVERGHEVSVLTTPQGRSALVKELEVLGLKLDFRFVEPPRISARIPRAYGFRYLLWLRKAFDVARTMGSFDVVHHASWGHMFSATHLWKLGYPTVMGPCGGAQVLPPELMPWLHGDQAAERMRSLSVKLNEYLPTVRQRISHCHMLPVNRESFACAERLGARSVTMFGDSAVEPEKIAGEPARNESADRVRVVWLGRMLPRKGAELALAAFDRAGVNASLLMIGGGPSFESVRAYASGLKSSGRITFTGRVPHEEVSMHLRKADIFLFTSLRDSGGAQFYEAMACGLPVVTLDLHGGAVIVPDSAGIKVPLTRAEDMPEAIASAIKTLYDDRPLRNRLAQGAIEEMRSQTWAHRAATAEALYSRL